MIGHSKITQESERRVKVVDSFLILQIFLEYRNIRFNEMFADHFGLSEKQAFNYLDRHKGFDFVKYRYEVMHTLDFEYAIADVQEVCQVNGGRL